MILLHALACAAIALQIQDPETESRALLQRAEALARDEHFEEARQLYKKLAERFSETAAGQVGVRRSRPSAFLGWKDLVRHGPSSNRVDVVLLGDGYTMEHLKAFDKLAEDVPRLFERQQTFREYWSYFNFIRADLLSADAGIDGFGRHYDTALGGKTLGTFAGHAGVDRAKVASALSEIPQSDGLAIVFVKLGVLGTGSRGIAVIGGMSATTTIHEWGHAFAGLADEYDAAQGRHPGALRSGINISNTDDPKKVPWAHWIEAGHPGVGVYEGAGARVRGAWKPTASGCVMDNGEFFCPVCQEALVLRIYSLVDPIEECSPAPPPPGIREPIVLRPGHDEPIELSVRVLRPASHDLEVSWWVLPESRVPETGGGPRAPGARKGSAEGPAYAPSDGSSGDAGTGALETARENAPAKVRYGDRRDRGRLLPIPDKPSATDRADEDGLHTLRLRSSELDPGRYKVVCRVKDTTRLRDEKWPWVLKDDFGLLESERVWWVRVLDRR